MAEIMLRGFQCERCGHTWAPREHEKPKVCPKCKSPYWNTPRKRRFVPWNQKKELHLSIL